MSPTPTHRSAREDAVSLAQGWLQVVSTHQRPPREDVDRAKPGLELALLDMDGTLIHGSSWEMLHDAFGVSNEENWLSYQRGELDDVSFIRSDIALWHVGDRRVHIEDIERVLARAKYLDGARELVASLRERHVATCIVSGGLDLLARRVCEDLGIDMYVANGLRLLDTGHLHGEGIVYVEIRDKARTAREILRKLDVPKHRAVGIGNSAYDVPMFRECGFGIAVNPSDPWVRRSARHVVEGTDLRPVIPLLADL